MKFLVTAVYWLVFALTAPLEVLVGTLVFLVTRPFDPERRVMHAFICRWTHQYVRIIPSWRVRVTGRELLPKGPCVLVANHQSMADVVVVMGLYHPFKFVSKASLFKLPLVGWMMKMAGYISIERGRTRSTQQMMESCRQTLRRGTPVLIFPEGTYSTGGQMLPFKRGAFQLALEEKVPLVPVVLRGTTGLVEGDGPWMSPRCDISVTVLPPLLPESFGEEASELAAKVRGRFEEVLYGAPAVPG